MIARILVPLDGSSLSEQVLPYASTLARALDAPLTLARVVAPGPLRRADPGEERIRAFDYLDTVRSPLRAQGLTVDTEVAVGPAADAIIATCNRHGAGLIAMTTRGRTGVARLTVGSVAERVLRLSALPLLLYRPRSTRRLNAEDAESTASHFSGGIRRLLVPLDGSQLSEQALVMAELLARGLGCDVQLVRAVQRAEVDEKEAGEYLAVHLDALRERGVGADVSLITGDAASSLVRAAAEGPGVLTVMSSNGRTGLGRMVHGSVADRVVRQSARPVLVVRSRPRSLADGRYLLERLLGEGNKKEVYLARDTVLDRDIALTLIKTQGVSEEDLARLTREAEALGTLGDQVETPRVFDAGEEQGYRYFVSGLLRTVQERVLNRDFVLAAAGTFCLAATIAMFQPTLPLYVRSLGGSAAAVGLVVGAGGLSQLLVRPLVGWLVDGKGRLPIILASAASFAAASLGLALAGAIPLLVLGMLVMGVAYSLGSTAVLTLVGEVVPPSRRGEAQGIFSIASQTGFGLGPVAAMALMTGSMPWEAVAPDDLIDASAFPFVGFAAMAVALVSLLAYGLIRDPYQAPGLRSLPRLKDSFRWEAFVPGFLNFTAVIPRAATVTLLPLYAVQRGLGNPGLLFLVSSVTTILMRQFTGRASDRYGRPAVFLPGLAVVGASMFLMAASSSPAMLLAAAAIYGAGTGAVIPVLTAYAGGVVPAQARGAAINTFALGTDVGLSAGAWTLGLAAAAFGPTEGFLAAAVSPLLGVACYLYWTRRTRQPVLAGEARTA